MKTYSSNSKSSPSSSSSSSNSSRLSWSKCVNDFDFTVVVAAVVSVETAFRARLVVLLGSDDEGFGS